MPKGSNKFLDSRSVHVHIHVSLYTGVYEYKHRDSNIALTMHSHSTPVFEATLTLSYIYYSTAMFVSFILK